MRLLRAVTCAFLGVVASAWLSAKADARAGSLAGSLLCLVEGNATGDAGTPAPTSAPGPDRTARDLAEFGGGLVIKGNEAEGYVSFTFDDGPSHATTPEVLEALAHYDVPATFFVVGRRIAGRGREAQKNALVLGDIVRAGHDLGNHTYSHQNLSAVPIAEVKREIDRNTRILTERLGYTPHAFRPPYGAITTQGRAHVRGRDMTEVRWSIDTGDFRPERGRTLRARTVKRIIAERGGVVLMHDTKKITARTVAGILDDLEAENCRRLGAGEPLIVPVSLHYFMRDRDGSPRAIPEAVAARTQRYRDGLPARCQARATAQGTTPAPAPAPTAP